MRTDGYVYAPSALNLLKELPVPTEKGPAWGGRASVDDLENRTSAVNRKKTASDVQPT
jgi:hypothetical protein